jgi:hypothetical protein
MGRKPFTAGAAVLAVPAQQRSGGGGIARARGSMVLFLCTKVRCATMEFLFLMFKGLCEFVFNRADRARWRKEQKWSSGHCKKCGYDLRATPIRCPECGTRTLDGWIIEGINKRNNSV